ncbi:TetR/AcrR family transcriptional regulator [Streptomyces sp. DSM 44917]|uniref:TetR/AcrR family transcriptional regulator n=1 Tax=Streptomyces boetiae TaxID=3075541 RepID=A0ABU2LCV4_9ACTN|nr:TetR/AcrR family transcriptional regulator [Streptomyces sp. DSM 44917]MDT0309407.1 TetR/AcrR family transcriptional regulator [Streptomyces sp. DSM 44917]
MSATLELLVEVGWSGATTRLIAQRAGMSQGALQHHFPDRAGLAVAALHRLAAELAAQIASRPRPTGGERERLAAGLDLLWEIHNTPPLIAYLELATASRTDPGLAPHVAGLTVSVTDLVLDLAAGLAPERAASGELRGFVLTALATMRGTVLLDPLHADAARADWATMRAVLLAGLPAPQAGPAGGREEEPAARAAPGS